MLPLAIATEDELSEAIALRILLDFPSIEVGLRLRKGGNGYLRSRMRNFREMALRGPVLVLTDLDTHVCPIALRQAWLRQLSCPSHLLLRVCVREIEAWLLADHTAVLSLLGNRVQSRLPDDPDRLSDPKAFLLELAKRATRDVRLDLRAEEGVIAKQGLGYNHRLSDLVRSSWSPARAAGRSHSLRRAIQRIGELVVR